MAVTMDTMAAIVQYRVLVVQIILAMVKASVTPETEPARAMIQPVTSPTVPPVMMAGLAKTAQWQTQGY